MYVICTCVRSMYGVQIQLLGTTDVKDRLRSRILCLRFPLWEPGGPPCINMMIHAEPLKGHL